jgi:hypothetical protein
MKFDGTCERGGFQRAPQGTGEIPPGLSSPTNTSTPHTSLTSHTHTRASHTRVRRHVHTRGDRATPASPEVGPGARGPGLLGCCFLGLGLSFWRYKHISHFSGFEIELEGGFVSLSPTAHYPVSLPAACVATQRPRAASVTPSWLSHWLYR